ncbi:hypothetical protein TCDM_06628 [Trypanosoma cruzi Dm28c]|uniref:PUB domain-containing protein n=1 Tax=Trypanosoma cruzi Dm28c TaxID=1416333 RepID=V5AWC2_TRYCR|nr:hypothetical protein TCDM_06628 [Trypanosoma cruzi Dm28c]
MLDRLSLLLCLMHRQASAECRTKALEILDMIFKNIITHPSVAKYRRINMASVMWERYLTPSFHILQFIEWLETLGFFHDTEHSSLHFSGSDVHGLIKAREEVCILLEAYSTPCREKTDGDFRGEKELLPLLRFIVGLTDDGGLKNDPSLHKEASPTCITGDVWEIVKSPLYLAVLGRVCERRGHGDLGLERVSQPPASLGRSWAWSSLVQVARELSLLQIEEDCAVVEAELFVGYEHIDCGGAEVKVLRKEIARRRVAEKHKNDFFLQEKKFAKAPAEVMCVATRLIVDIASCMEQIAVLEEEKGMVRKDRLEARRLLGKFEEDADIAYLHSLKEEWLEWLEAAKQKSGKLLVYTQEPQSEPHAR